MATKKKIEVPFQASARIKVVGVGGSGGNAINHMVRAGIEGVEFIAINTDAQDLYQTEAQKFLRIGEHITKGYGAGMDPDVGRKAAEESRKKIQDLLEGADMVFVTGGLGGGTCSGAAPMVAEIAKNTGTLTVAVVTKPFSFEQAQRARIAQDAWDELRERVDALVTISNDRILDLVDRRTSLRNAFAMVDEVLRQAVQGISDLVTVPGLINLDFADIKATLADAGPALIGIGKASGQDRAAAAARAAINSPLLNQPISGASRVLFNITGNTNLALSEANEAARVITETADPEAKIMFGAHIQEKFPKKLFKIVVLAAGFEEGIPQKENRSAEGKEIKPQEASDVEDFVGTKLDLPAFIRRKLEK